MICDLAGAGMGSFTQGASMWGTRVGQLLLPALSSWLWKERLSPQYALQLGSAEHVLVVHRALGLAMRRFFPTVSACI